MSAAQIMMGAGSAMQATGQINAAQAQASAAEYNAGQANQQAGLEELKSQDDARRIGIQSARAIGDLRANIGASGVQLDGSALDLLSYSAKNAELDRQNAIYAGQARAGALRNQAQLYGFQAKNARTAGYLSAASTLIGGGADISKMGSYSMSPR